MSADNINIADTQTLDQDDEAIFAAFGPSSASAPSAVERDADDDAILAAMGGDPNTEYLPPVVMPQISDPRDQELAEDYDLENIYKYRLTDAQRIEFEARNNPNPDYIQGKITEIINHKTRAAKREIEGAKFPADNINLLARQLSGNPEELPNEKFIEALQSSMADPASRPWLEQMWMEKMVGHMVGPDAMELHAVKAEALSADSAVQAATFRRLIEDEYGGLMTWGGNHATDALKAAGRQFNRTGIRVAEWASAALKFSNELPESTGFRRTLIDSGGKKTKEDEENTLFYRNLRAYAANRIDEFTKDQNEKANLTYFVGSKTFSSKLAQGAGSIIPSMAMFALGNAPGTMFSYLVNEADINDSLKESGLDTGTSNLISATLALPAAALDKLSFNTLRGAKGSFSPGRRWLREGIWEPTKQEIIAEGGQAFIPAGAGEIGGIIMDPVNNARGFGEFIADRGPEMLEEALIGGIVGGGMGAAVSKPIRVASAHTAYRKGQRFLSKLVETNKNIPEANTKPELVTKMQRKAVQDAGAPEIMFQDANYIRTLFQDRPSDLNDYLQMVDVTPQQFETAVAAGAQIKVDTVGLGQYLKQSNAIPDIQGATQVSPEAPTMAIIADEIKAEQEFRDEIRNIQDKNEKLPDPFRILRDQLTDVGLDAEGAQHSADVLYALSKVAGKRMGLTPEQFLNLNPIQVVLARQLEQARRVGDVAAEIEAAEMDKIGMAAQEAYTLHQAERSGKAEFISSPSGNTDYGFVEPSKVSPERQQELTDLKAAPIRLERGTRGWGRNHMRSRSRDIIAQVESIAEAVRIWEEQNPGHTNAQRDNFVVESFVEYMANNYDDIEAGHSGRVRLVKDLGNKGVIVLQLKEDAGEYYSAITAMIRRKGGSADRGGRDYRQLNTGDTSQVSESRPDNTAGGDGNIRTPGQSALPIDTIPANEANVKQWLDESLGNILQQSGVKPEQTESFKRFAQSLLNAGEQIDADTMSREFNYANTAAQGLDLAADGLQRILEAPEGLTEPVLNALDLGVEPARAVAALQERIAELRGKAQAYREFHNNQGMRQTVREGAERLADTGQRGDVTITPDINTIRLFHGRQDRSTVVHELFHIYNGYFAEAALAKDASSQLAADFKTLNDAVGGGLESANPDVRRVAEEKAASLFERYLFEGKAPAPGLMDAFRRFRTWMTNIYRQVANIGELDMTPEVQGVFDRMLATEDDITQGDFYYRTLETLAPPSGATAKETENINQRAQRAKKTAEERQFGKVLDEYLASRGNREGIRREARDEVRAQRQYKTIAAIRDGGGISREFATSLIGDTEARRLSDTHWGLFGKNAGMNEIALNALAEQHGYTSIADMLADMAAAPKYREAVQMLRDRKMAESEALVRLAMQQDSATAVDEAYHSDALSDALAAKQAVLDRQAVEQARTEGRRVERQLTNAALKRIAEDFIANQDSRKGTRYFEFVNAYRKHAESSVRADAVGDKITAAKEYQQMRLNHYIIKEAIQAQNDVKRFEKKNTRYSEWMKRLEGRDQKGMAPVEEGFRNAIRDVLATWKVVRDPRIAPQTPMGETITVPVPNAEANPELAAFAPPLNDYVSPWITNREGADKIQSWRDLTVGQVRELGAALDILTKKGRGELQGLKALGTLHGLGTGPITTREQLKTALLQSLADMPDYKGVDRREDMGRLRRSLESYFVSNLQVDRIASEIDGNPTLKGKAMGVMQNVIRLIRGAEVKQMEMLDKFKAESAEDYAVLDGMAKRLIRDFKSDQFIINGVPMPEAITSRKFFNTWDADMVRAIYFNMGNESNLSTLKAAYGFTDAQIQALASLATEAEWRAIERLGKRIGDLYPVLDEIYFRQTNKHLEKVESTPITVTTSDGKTITLDGWYYPKKYDSELSNSAAKNQEMTDLMATMNGIFSRNKLERGFTNKRQENVKLPLLLNTGVLVDHMTVATRWATHAEALLEFEAVTTDPLVQDMMIQKIGAEKYRYLREWANRMAKPDKGTKSGVVSKLRKASTVAGLGWNVRSALRQNESLGIAADILSKGSRTKTSGWYWLLQGVKRMGLSGITGGIADFRNYGGSTIIQSEAVSTMHALSPEAKMRARNVSKEIREITEGADPTRSRGVKIGKIRLSSDIFFHFTYAMDQAVASTCWWAAYEQGRSGNAGFDVAGLTDAQIQEKSVAWADSVLRSQQSPYKADITNFQADPGIRSLFTQFMGGVTPYLSHSAGVAQAYRRGDVSAVGLVQHLVNTYAIPAFGYAIVPLLIKRAILGNDDDDESLAGKFAWAMLSNMTAPLPYVSNAVSAAQYDTLFAMPPSLTIPFSTAGSGLRGAKKLYEGETEAAMSDFGRALRILFPIYNPLRQMRQVGELTGVVEEDKR